jgi:hypothetical protein
MEDSATSIIRVEESFTQKMEKAGSSKNWYISTGIYGFTSQSEQVVSSGNVSDHFSGGPQFVYRPELSWLESFGCFLRPPEKSGVIPHIVVRSILIYSLVPLKGNYIRRLKVTVMRIVIVLCRVVVIIKIQGDSLTGGLQITIKKRNNLLMKAELKAVYFVT